MGGVLKRIGKMKTLVAHDGSTVQRGQSGVIIVTDLDRWFFDTEGANELVEACAALAKHRKTPITLVIDVEAEQKGTLWRDITAELPDVIAGWNEKGEIDIPCWQG